MQRTRTPTGALVYSYTPEERQRYVSQVLEKKLILAMCDVLCNIISMTDCGPAGDRFQLMARQYRNAVSGTDQEVSR